MWPTSTSRLERTDWWDNHLKSVRLLERVKSKYKSQFNANATVSNRSFRTFFVDKRNPEINHQPHNGNSVCFLQDNSSYNFQGNSQSSGGQSRATKLESARSVKLPWSARSKAVMESELQLKGKKVIRISGLSKDMCVPSVLAQLRGGRLEKVIHHEDENWLEVFFLSTANASRFIRFCCNTGLFVVNGKPLVVEWSTTPEAWACETTSLPSYVIEEVEMSKASRVVILSKPIGGISSEMVSTKLYPNPRARFSEDFRIESVKWDFIAFGGMVEVSPMISPMLSVSIQFTDIRSALLAMRTMHQESSMLRSKYSQWTLQYGKDPAQQPCYAV